MPDRQHRSGLRWARGDAHQRRRISMTAIGSGTKDDPWQLRTPPGTSDYAMYRDEEHDPPRLVCVVGSTTLYYDLRAIDDLAAMLKQAGDWIPLGSADENKPAKDGTVEAWGRSESQPGRRLVRPAQGLSRPIRHVPSATAGGARSGRVRTPAAQQSHAGQLAAGGLGTRCDGSGCRVTLIVEATKLRLSGTRGRRI